MGLVGRLMIYVFLFRRCSTIVPYHSGRHNSAISHIAFSLFTGVAPPSFLAIQAGTTLQSLTSSSDSVSWTSVAVLCVFAVLAMLPVVFKKYLREKVD